MRFHCKPGNLLHSHSALRQWLGLNGSAMPKCYMYTIRKYKKMLSKFRQVSNRKRVCTTWPGDEFQNDPVQQNAIRSRRRRGMHPRSWSYLSVTTRCQLLDRGCLLPLLKEHLYDEDTERPIIYPHDSFTTHELLPMYYMNPTVLPSTEPLSASSLNMELPPLEVTPKEQQIPSKEIFHCDLDTLAAVASAARELPCVYDCKPCERSFPSLPAFNAHQRVHYKPTKYKCQYCSKVFVRSWLLKGHLRVHTGERPFKCRHFGCTKAFADRSNLRAHALIHTESSKRWKCPICGKLFAQKRYLHKHLTEVCKVARGRRLEPIVVEIPSE